MDARLVRRLRRPAHNRRCAPSRSPFSATRSAQLRAQCLCIPIPSPRRSEPRCRPAARQRRTAGGADFVEARLVRGGIAPCVRQQSKRHAALDQLRCDLLQGVALPAVLADWSQGRLSWPCGFFATRGAQRDGPALAKTQRTKSERVRSKCRTIRAVSGSMQNSTGLAVFAALVSSTAQLPEGLAPASARIAKSATEFHRTSARAREMNTIFC